MLAEGVVGSADARDASASLQRAGAFRSFLLTSASNFAANVDDKGTAIKRGAEYLRCASNSTGPKTDSCGSRE